MLVESFQVPEFAVRKIACVALGAVILWGLKRHVNLRAYGLSALLDEFPMHRAVRVCLEFLFFLILGSAAGIILAEPSTAKQAFAAGLGWTGLIAKQEATSTDKPSKKRTD